MPRNTAAQKEELALYGGTPVRRAPLPFMHPGASAINEDEIAAVTRVLESKSLYRFYGPEFLDVTGAFERGYHPDVATPTVGINFVWIINAAPTARNLSVDLHPEYRDVPMGQTHPKVR